MSTTQNFGFERFGQEGRISDNNNKYSDRDRATFDALFWTLYNHDHRDTSVTSSLAAPVYRPEAIPQKERFRSEALVSDLRQRGVGALYLPDVDEIVGYIKSHLQNDDLIITFSNGSFGNIHHKLITDDV